MKTKLKSNQLIAFILCAAIAAGSIGMVLARERGPGDAGYSAVPLTLMAGQIRYDLTEGVSFDETAYTLSVHDQSSFDVTRPGHYEVTLALTPVPVTATPAPTEPAVPTETSAPAEEVPVILPAQSGAPIGTEKLMVSNSPAVQEIDRLIPKAGFAQRLTAVTDLPAVQESPVVPETPVATVPNLTLASPALTSREMRQSLGPL
ncbi:MAG: hypothetical protein RR450_08340 [Oscillospiraceae bacterium]